MAWTQQNTSIKVDAPPVGGRVDRLDELPKNRLELVEGLAGESFGLHAARAAGLPDAVLRLAQAKREELDSEEEGAVVVYVASSFNK